MYLLLYAYLQKLNMDLLPKTLRQQIITFRRKPTKEFLHQLYEVRYPNNETFHMMFNSLF